MGQPEKSDTFLKEAIGTYQALIADGPDDPEHRKSLGRTYIALGGHYFVNRQAKEAEAAHQQALQIYEKLAQEHPDVWEYAYQLGRSYHNLAEDAQLEHRWDAMLANDGKAIAILEQLVRKGYGQVRSELLDVRVLHAGMLAERGEHARATDEANAVAREEAVGQIHHYNIACVFAVSSAAAENDGKLAAADRTRLKAQYADRALEFLRQAVAEGFQDTSLLKDDPDLASLRSREDLHELVRRWNGRVGSSDPSSGSSKNLTCGPGLLHAPGSASVRARRGSPSTAGLGPCTGGSDPRTPPPAPPPPEPPAAA